MNNGLDLGSQTTIFAVAVVTVSASVSGDSCALTARFSAWEVVPFEGVVACGTWGVVQNITLLYMKN